MAEKILGCGMAHGVWIMSGRGDADRAEGAVVTVVKAYDGDILRHALSRAQKRSDEMKGNLVIVACLLYTSDAADD